MGLQSPSERLCTGGGDADASLLSLSCLINKKTRTKRV